MGWGREAGAGAGAAGRRLSLAAVVIVACACGRVEAPSHALAPTTCGLRGKVTLHRRIPVLTQANGAVAHAVVIGQLGLELQRITPVAGADEARAFVSIRSEPTGPAFHLEGFVDARELALYTTRELVVVPGHVTIKRGARVEALGVPRSSGSGAGAGLGARVGAIGDACATVDTRRVQADVACGDLSLEPAAEPSPRHAVRHPATFRGARIPLLAAPDGPTVWELPSRSGSLTLDVLETTRSMRHVRYEHEIVIDGWLAAPPLAEDEGDDDGCDSLPDADDLCPDEPEGEGDEASGCPASAQGRTLRLSADADVRLSPELGRSPVGHADRGAEVVVVEERGDWASVVPVVHKSSMAPAPGAGAFWIRRAAL
jgi:hypothetical protein